MKDNTSKTIIIVACIFGFAILGYGFLNYSAKMQSLESDKQTKELEIQKEKDNALQLQRCLLAADIAKTDYWNKLCKDYGVDSNGNPDRKDDCALYKNHQDAVSAFLKNEQDKCYQLYK